MDLIRVYILGIATGAALFFAGKCTAHAGPTQVQKPGLIRVAIIDSGLNVGNYNGPLCASGHLDLTNSGLQDTYNHGHNMATIIAEQAQFTEGWCLVVIKYTNETGANIQNYLSALQYVGTQNIQVLNLSLSGDKEDTRETALLRNLLSKNIQIVVSAGNRGLNLDHNCAAFPSCAEERLLVVGAPELASSNRGRIVDINAPGTWHNIRGTSVAAAHVTGEIVNRALKLRAKK